MIKLEKTKVVGFEPALRGMRNPKNSWDKADSKKCNAITCKDEDTCENRYNFCIGENDHDLAMRLAKGGPVHAKYRRMITVYVDITAPLYWWKEFDTYKVGTVANSCSTMHKIHEKEFTLDDFSHEHLINMYDENGEIPIVDMSPLRDETHVFSPKGVLKITIEMLNKCRDLFLETKKRLGNDCDSDEYKRLKELAKKYWWQMIQLLPSSYNQRRTVMLSYEVLANIYKWRKNHKLDEWREFCKWIENLPYSEIITQAVVEESAEKVKIQIEAYKRFAEMLKKHMCSYDLDNHHGFEAVEEYVIDELLEELLMEVEDAY